MNIQKLDEVIEKIEDGIINAEMYSGMIKADMIKALAELIKARAMMELVVESINKIM